MVAIRVGDRMARGWHYTKLSPSSALLLSCFWHVLCVIIVPFFLSFLSCLWFVLFSCSRCSFVEDVPLIFSCPADHVPDWPPRILLGMVICVTTYIVEARSVSMKNTTATTTVLVELSVPWGWLPRPTTSATRDGSKTTWYISLKNARWNLCEDRDRLQGHKPSAKVLGLKSVESIAFSKRKQNMCFVVYNIPAANSDHLGTTLATISYLLAGSMTRGG